MMAAIDKIVFLLLILLGVSTAQPPLFRNVKVQCYKSSKDNTLSTFFTAQLNGDDINYLFGLELMAGSSPPMYTRVSSADCAATITTDGFIYLESKLDLNDLTLSSDPCGFGEVMSNDPVPVLLGYSWRIGLRQYEQYYITYQDRDYTWDCAIDSATDTMLTATLEVISDLEVPLEPTLPDISFYVIRGNQDEPITECTVGELLRFQLKMTFAGYLDNLTPWGIYSIETLVNYENNFDGGDGLYGLTENNGCITDPNILDLLYGFTRDTARATGSQANLEYIARTGEFRCRKYQDHNTLYFRTIVDTCTGELNPVPQRDQRCEDFCSFSTTGRRKRQVGSEGNFTKVVTSIRVIVEEDKDESPQKSEGVSTTVLIVVPTVVGVALILLISMVVYCCLASRNGAIRKRRLDSRTSSERSMPVKF